MAINPNFNKPSLVKPIIIIVAILAIIGLGYIFFGKKLSKDTASENSYQGEIVSSGIDADQSVKNVGDVEEVVAKWIEANPQAIINSVTNMQKKVMEEQTKNAQKSISSKKGELYNDKNSPAIAPKGHDIVVVEFFDYNCGYCKKSNETVESLIKSDNKIKFVYKEFPILGQTSEDLSVVAIAVNMIAPESYVKFHNALMTSHVQSKNEAIKLAGTLGVNTSKLQSTIDSKKDKIMEIINANRTLGASIGVNGTPAFVIGEELVSGASDLEGMKQKVNEQRKK